MTEIAWHLLNPVDVGAQVQQGFATGMAMVKQVQTNNALRAYMANPDDPKALSALSYYAPEQAQALEHRKALQAQAQQQAEEDARQRQADAIKARQENIVKGAAILREVNPQNDDQWQQALGMAANAGVDISNAPQQFDPEWTKQIIATADALAPQKESTAPANIREYEYARSQGFGGTFMDFLNAQGSPLAVTNEDGTKTIYPRGYFAQQQGASAPPPSDPAHAAVAGVLSSGGLPAPVVAGFLGNFHAEGGYGGARGDGGSAAGIAQWRGERQANFERVIGKPVGQATPDEQARFVLWELQNPEAAGMSVAERDAILAAPTPAAAAALIDQYYERSSGQHRERRMAASSQIAGQAPPARPKSKAEFDALPSGAEFVAPDGSLRRKP